MFAVRVASRSGRGQQKAVAGKTGPAGQERLGDDDATMYESTGAALALLHSALQTAAIQMITCFCGNMSGIPVLCTACAQMD